MEQVLELPEDSATLQQLVLVLTRENQQLKAQQDTLQEQIRLLLHSRFGANSEKYRADIVTGKFLDALPLYRQSKQFQRLGVYIPRTTLAYWMIRCGELIQTLCNLMQEQLNQCPIQQMDETSVQVLKEDGKAATSASYPWVQYCRPPPQPVILFSYAPSRSQAVADQLLKGFTGTLQTDGYAGYPGVCAKNGLRHADCWAHGRRKFDEALKAHGSKGQVKAAKP